MVHAVIDDNNNVAGTFANPQPGYPGYVEISDDDPRLLAFQRKGQLPAVDAIANARLGVGYSDTTTGKTYQCDDRSRGFLTGVGASAASMLAQSPQPQYQLITADNSTVTLNASDAFALINTRIMPWVSATIFYARQLKDQILAGQSPDLTQGWP